MSSQPRSKSWRDRLFAPHTSVTARGLRRQAQLLAQVSLILGTVILLLLVVTIPTTGRIDASAGLSLLILAVSYGLSRSKFARIGSMVLVFGLLALDFFLFVQLKSTLSATVFLFILLPILIATVLLPTWLVALTAALANIGLIVYAELAPWVSLTDNLPAVVGSVIITALIVLISAIQDRDIRVIGAQAETVDQYSGQLEADVKRITAAAEVGRAVTATRDLDTLLKTVVDLIIDRFDFYHAQVFLIDDIGRWAVLRESTGDVGQQLLDRGHRLEVGSQSVIGQVTSRAESVIARDTDADAVHRRNELLPLTRAEMALPLRVGGRVIGALDVQSTKPDAFQPTDIPVFQTMADQLAVAIENARLFDQAQRDLRNIERLNRQLTREAWRDSLSEQDIIGYEASGGTTHPITEDTDEDGMYSVPLQVRGETIGALDVASPDGSPPDEAVQAMLSAVAERVALALDTTRLNEQSQRQAVREEILSRVSAEMQATNDLNTILRIASREASRAMDTPRGFIHLTLEYMDQEEDGEDA